ncbi:hypothetical protein COCHEDRAFT_1203262 [Bipolaris maydis C5]|uniref:Epoxide hydrolase N-terminal domain-containing protein n=1 Tax=Cochliobolus heterostrophus (strain C5 / ATCC 48332 / race O) TaxID=701091 RepID=M2UEY5_COCH5|nr:hypothetical protein COCHEDRAFT_1203262 [Bipolaris maydis C5]
MGSVAHGDEVITTYSMHVSSKYLELTRKKLELTRLPRELELPEERMWEHGTPKRVLEPLLDFWLETYDWRAAESRFNSLLPQFRTTIRTTSPSGTQSLRMHFVHKRSTRPGAIPLLLAHTWPSSFIEVQRIINALTEPQYVPDMGGAIPQAFHVVAPSIPGFGFSDASMQEGFGLEGTAEVFWELMGRLGYSEFVAHGMGWGFSICRVLAIRYPKSCLAVHTVNPAFKAPTCRRSPLQYFKWRIAELTQAKVPLLSFGYVGSDVEPQSGQRREDLGKQNEMGSSQPLGPALHRLYSLRPQTLAFSLCDSPVGLLAALLDVIHTRDVAPRPFSGRPRSPFLSPVELEMQQSDEEQVEVGQVPSGLMPQSPNYTAREEESDGKRYTWSPTEVLNFTMLQWLPGPEAALRWLRRAYMDTMAPWYSNYVPTPLGVSTFLPHNSNSSAPLMWGTSFWDMSWVKRHNGRSAMLPGFETPDTLVLDLRECFSSMVEKGRIIFKVPEGYVCYSWEKTNVEAVRGCKRHSGNMASGGGTAAQEAGISWSRRYRSYRGGAEQSRAEAVGGFVE